MLELYHNAVSTCSQKVRLVLEEKGLEWKSHVVDLVGGGQHDPDYVKLNPNHVVPTLVHDGQVLIESTLINDYLDDAFPEIAMRSADPFRRHAASMWIKRVDTKVHPSAGVITFAIGPRKMLMDQPEEVRERNIAAIPDPARRAARRSVLEHGVKAPEFAGALGQFLDLIDAMDESLSPGEWLSGERYGLADACVLPYVFRLDQLAMGSLLATDVRPNVANWYARMQGLPKYAKAVTDWIPEPILNLFHANGEAVWADVESLTRR
jgi:glutathione S-transferase